MVALIKLVPGIAAFLFFSATSATPVERTDVQELSNSTFIAEVAVTPRPLIRIKIALLTALTERPPLLRANSPPPQHWDRILVADVPRPSPRRRTTLPLHRAFQVRPLQGPLQL